MGLFKSGGTKKTAPEVVDFVDLDALEDSQEPTAAGGRRSPSPKRQGAGLFDTGAPSFTTVTEIGTTEGPEVVDADVDAGAQKGPASPVPEASGLPGAVMAIPAPSIPQPAAGRSRASYDFDVSLGLIGDEAHKGASLFDMRKSSYSPHMRKQSRAEMRKASVSGDRGGITGRKKSVGGLHCTSVTARKASISPHKKSVMLRKVSMDARKADSAFDIASSNFAQRRWNDSNFTDDSDDSDDADSDSDEKAKAKESWQRLSTLILAAAAAQERTSAEKAAAALMQKINLMDQLKSLSAKIKVSIVAEQSIVRAVIRDETHRLLMQGEDIGLMYKLKSKWRLAKVPYQIAHKEWVKRRYHKVPSFHDNKLQHVHQISKNELDSASFVGDQLVFDAPGDKAPDLQVVLAALHAGFLTLTNAAMARDLPPPKPSHLELKTLIFDDFNVTDFFDYDKKTPSITFFFLLGLVARQEITCNLLDKVEKLGLCDRTLDDEEIDALCTFIEINDSLHWLKCTGYGQFTGYGESLTLSTDMQEADYTGMTLECAGMHIISSFLPRMSVLTSLNVSHNHIGGHDDEPGVHLLAGILRENANITDFDLSFNDFDEECGWIIADAIRENTTLKKLTFSGDVPDSKPVVMDLAIGPHGDFRGKNMESCGAFIFSAFLPRCTKVTSVDILNNKLSKDGVTEFIRAFRLLGQNRLVVGGSGARYGGDPSWQLTSWCGIKVGSVKVDMSGRDLDFADCMLLAAELKKNTTCTSLDICKNKLARRNQREAAEEEEAIHNLRFGKHVDLRFDKKDPVGVQLLCRIIDENKLLKEITFGGSQSFSIPITMKTDMTEADYSGKVLEWSGCLLLATFLKKCQLMRKLTFSGDEEYSQTVVLKSETRRADFRAKDLRAQGAMMLGAFLPCCTILVTLDLSGNDLGIDMNFEADMAGISALFHSLAHNRCLQTLNVSNNALVSWNNETQFMDYSGMAALSTALQSNTALTDLNVSENHLCRYGSVTGVIQLLAGLEDNEGLSRLNVSKNGLPKGILVQIQGALEEAHENTIAEAHNDSLNTFEGERPLTSRAFEKLAWADHSLRRVSQSCLRRLSTMSIEF
jgi:hypothetical protein